MEKSKSNLDEIRKTTKMIANIMLPEDAGVGGIIIHPFLNSAITYIYNEWINVLEKENYNKWYKEFCKIVDQCNLPLVYEQWREPWKLTFMKFCGEFLTEQEYAEYMADAWVTEENPNMDANVSIKDLLKMFKKCKKKYLMTEEDYEYWKKLPDKIELYRGVSKGRIKIGLSWTDDKEIAKWFMNRWKGENNCLLKVKADKKDIIAYFNTRNEKECLLDVLKYKDKIKEVHKI